jgi:hypothetical protein
VRSRLPKNPQPVPPIYQPEVAARGVLFAADHPAQREYWVGASTTATIMANRLAPAVLDRYLARTGYGSQQTPQAADHDRPDNLQQPVDGGAGHDHGARGDFDDKSHDRSPQLWLAQHGAVPTALAAGATVAATLVARRWSRRR